jgi:hypothetical protein
VAEALDGLSVEQARHMGGLAQRKVLTEHTYAQRASQVQQCLLASPRDMVRTPCHG